MIYHDDFMACISNLLARADISAEDFCIQSASHGGNNRTYRIEAAGKCYAVKQYFREAADKRDRLTSEFSFLLYAKDVATDFVPHPYSKDEEHGVALYEYVDGKPLSTNDITNHEICQAISFFCALNDSTMKAQAVHLPYASEVSFSIEGQLQLIGKRIDLIRQAVVGVAEDKNVISFISDLNLHWQNLLRVIKTTTEKNRMNLSDELDYSQRCISPSDFGFHNALRTANGKVRFIDFEYAGWDDPARMVGDFFSQLAVPIDIKYFEQFAHEVMAPFPQPELLVQRARLLRSVYQIKWCCIALNVFIPVNLARRKFANPDLNILELKKIQLAKAETLLQTMETLKYG